MARHKMYLRASRDAQRASARRPARAGRRPAASAGPYGPGPRGPRGPRRMQRREPDLLAEVLTMVELRDFVDRYAQLSPDHQADLWAIVDGQAIDIDIDDLMDIEEAFVGVSSELDRMIQFAIDKELDREDVEDDAYQAVDQDVKRMAFLSRRKK